MFRSRAPPKGLKKKGLNEEKERDAEQEGESGPEDQTQEKLAELRAIQNELWKRPRGVTPAPESKKKEEEEAEDEEEDQWGLLEKGFAGSSGQKGSDPHLEAFLQERLFERKVEEGKKEKTREEKLYEVPAHLQVHDGQSGSADKMSWVAGLAEVPLGIEHKLANIEATERAKREFLMGERSQEAMIEPDAITRKAFGTRFQHFPSQESKSASDDAALERFRKRMRRG